MLDKQPFFLYFINVDNKFPPAEHNRSLCEITVIRSEQPGVPHLHKYSFYLIFWDLFVRDSLLCFSKQLTKGAFFMENLRNLLQSDGFHKFLFFIGIIVFNWPFVTIFEKKDTETVFISLYLSWGFIIFLLFCIAQSHKAEKSEYKEVKKGEVADV